MLKIAIVGCGKIADSHASQIRRIPGTRLVAAVDREPLMARDFRERFEIDAAFTDLGEMLREARPDVVHITTPAGSHHAIAMECMEHGCHVYIEKPVTLYASETEELVRCAERRGLKLTVGHDAQFSPVAIRMRERIREGYLGGKPVHMESTYCYDLGDPVYARALLGNKDHWIRRLPGMLLQNVISHGVAKIVEYIESDDPVVIAHGFVSPLLRQIGEEDIVDELRVIINDGNRRTAYFTFSSQMRPSLNRFRAYGPDNGLVLDETQQTLIACRGERYKSFGERFLPSLVFARQFLGNALRNFRWFLGRSFHFEAGKKNLIERYYGSIRSDGEVPIPYREIVLAAVVMERIFEQVHGSGRTERPALQGDPQAEGSSGESRGVEDLAAPSPHDTCSR